MAIAAGVQACESIDLMDEPYDKRAERLERPKLSDTDQTDTGYLYLICRRIRIDGGT